jgi:hypothetical protein
MLSHFLRAVSIRGSLFNVLREKQVKGDPAGLMLEEAPDRPRKASAWSGNQQASLTEPKIKKPASFPADLE